MSILMLGQCHRDPWVLPIEAGARRTATLAKRDLAQGAGGCSDHLALVRAYNGWTAAKRSGGHFKYAASMFLSNGTMTMIEGMRGQLLGELTVSSPGPYLPSLQLGIVNDDAVASSFRSQGLKEGKGKNCCVFLLRGQ